MFKKKKSLSLEMYSVSFLCFFYLISVKDDWGTILAILLAYLWITHWKKIRMCKKLVVLTLIVMVFHNFCGKLLLLEKSCVLLCFLISYFSSCSRLEYYRLLRLFSNKKRKGMLKLIARFSVYHSFLKSVGELDKELGAHRKYKGRWLLRKLLYKKSKPYQQEVYSHYELRLFQGSKKEAFFTRDKIDTFFLGFHIIFLLICLL